MTDIGNAVRVGMWKLQEAVDGVVQSLGVQAFSIQRTVSPVDSSPHYSAVLVRISNMALGDGDCVEDALLDALDKLREREEGS